MWFEVHTTFKSCRFCHQKFFADAKCFCRENFFIRQFLAVFFVWNVSPHKKECMPTFTFLGNCWTALLVWQTLYRVWRDSNGQSSFGQGSISPAWQQKMMQSLHSFVRCRAVKTALACDLWLPCRMSLGETMSLGFLAPYLGFELCCFVMDFGGAVEAIGGD